MLNLAFQKYGAVLARGLTAAFAVLAIVWASAVIPAFSSQDAMTEVAVHILAGESYSPAVMETLTALADRDSDRSTRSSYLRAIAIVRLRNAETATKSGGRRAIDANMTALRWAIDTSLANSPEDPFLWMVRFWIENTVSGVTSENLRLLRMSYQLGPREGWIAGKRNGLALTIFSRLPADLAENVMQEFAGLVGSGFHAEAAAALTGPGWPWRKQLLERLRVLGEQDRRMFARKLYDKDVEDAVVPGIEPPALRLFH